MSDAPLRLKTQLARQIAHWSFAVSRLEKLDELVAPEGWNGLETYLGVSIRQHLGGVVDRLKRQARLLEASLDAVSTTTELESVRRHVLQFRHRFLRAETTLDFYADAVNSRASSMTATLLRACDTMAQRSMSQVFDQIGKPTPLVLTYIDKGLGASILKAGLRLWDGASESVAAAIKIVRHNLQRPTALIHETGHQVAHDIGWNEELASALETGLSAAPLTVAETWAGWSSEIAADAFAFCHTGYASVAALHDVLAGDHATVFRQTPGDPHPISFVRILLGVQMCREFYGAGPWDDLAEVWIESHPLENARGETAELVQASFAHLPAIANILLRRPLRGLRGRPISALVDPVRVSPEALAAMEHRLGSALYTSMHWIWTESLRLLALSGFKLATQPGRGEQILRQHEAWMLRLGATMQAVRN